jgi:predicted ATPase/class 3 adenylate cyclase
VTPPAGMVTLFVSDIEGSTARWEQDPEGMRLALARHDELLHTSIASSHGAIFKTVGDTLCAAFESPLDGVVAAVSAQLALQAETWGGDQALLVRIGLHTGVCEEHDGVYLGPTVQRAEQLSFAAHGGQIVTSRLTAELVEGLLPPEMALHDLGEHRLKDLGYPEQVFQLTVESLGNDFPPLRTLDNPLFHNNLPLQLNSFIGRERELAATRRLVEKNRLVTLTGPGGSGKTRLALQTAASFIDGRGDGVWFVGLAAVADPDLVPQAVAESLGVVEEAGRPVLETLVEALSQRYLLMVLDNSEHLIGAVADLASVLMRSCPRVYLLATSREPLGVSSEQIFKVPSLSVPPVRAQINDASEAREYEAVQLFVDRALRHDPHFELGDNNVQDVIAICRRLDGIPLAIELAAARLRTLSLGEISGRLDDRFRLLSNEGPAEFPRQKTLRALVDWSYDLLDERERDVLSRLSVFAGGFTLNAAEAVCVSHELEGWQILETLSSLTDKSLVQAETTDATYRYQLLETIRQYAEERLAERGETERFAARDAHAAFYLGLAESAAPHLIGGDQKLWLERLTFEHDNLRVAMSYHLSVAARHEQALRFGIALRWFWYARCHWAEGDELTSGALELPGSHAPRELRSAALCTAGHLCARRADLDRAEHHLEEGLKIARVLDNHALIADNLSGLAWVAYKTGQRELSISRMNEAIEVGRDSGNDQLIGRLLERRGSVSYQADALGDTEACRADFAEALTYLERAGDRFGIGIVENNIGDLALLEGQADLAEIHLRAAIAIAEDLQDDSIVVSLFNLGHVGILQGRPEEARSSYLKSMTGARKIGDQSIALLGILGIAFCETAVEEFTRATVLHGAVDAHLERAGEMLEAVESRLRERDHAILRDVLGEAGFERQYRTGRSLPLNQAQALALESRRTAHPSHLAS